MNISPLATIPVSYSVLPTDATLYYVRAVLRDTQANKVLQTINLTQDPANAYRYTGLFQSVSDPSGLGRYIDITTIAYTDSGYTTPSPNYGAEQVSYVVVQPATPSGFGNAGRVDYEKIEGLVRKNLTEQLYGSEAEKRGFSLIPRPKFEYSRIGREFRQAITEAVQELSGLVEGHMASLPALLDSMKEDIKGHASESHQKSLEVFDRLEERMGSLSTKGDTNHVITRNEFAQAVAEARKEIVDLHKNSYRNLDKKLDDTSKNSLSELKKHAATLIGKKPLSVSLSMGGGVGEGEDKPIRNSRVEDIMSLLS